MPIYEHADLEEFWDDAGVYALQDRSELQFRRTAETFASHPTSINWAKLQRAMAVHQLLRSRRKHALWVDLLFALDLSEVELLDDDQEGSILEIALWIEAHPDWKG